MDWAEEEASTIIDLMWSEYGMVFMGEGDPEAKTTERQDWQKRIAAALRVTKAQGRAEAYAQAREQAAELADARGFTGLVDEINAMQPEEEK